MAATNKDLPRRSRRAVPRGPVLPAERHPDFRAAAARRGSRTSRCWPSTSWRELAARVRPPAEDGSAPEAAGRLQQYRWPGNVRELRNVIERLMIMVPATRSPRRTWRSSIATAWRRRAAATAGAGAAAARGARSVRARLHPARARGAAGQHVAHRRSARRRAEQSLRKMRAFGIAPRSATPRRADRTRRWQLTASRRRSSACSRGPGRR